MLNDFSKYEQHYLRMQNGLPDWEEAEKKAIKYACKKPWLPSNLNARILDFGCGWGQQLLSLWCAGYRNIEGVDIVEKQVNLALSCAKERIKITCMNGIQFLSDKDDHYDLIILNDVLEHIPPNEAKKYLIFINKALKNGGVIVIRVPNMANMFASYSRYLDITHVAGYTEYSLMQLLDQAGFENHHLVLPSYKSNWSIWRPWIPWRGLNIRRKIDYLLHKFLYWLRGYTKPKCFDHNVEIYSYKIR